MQFSASCSAHCSSFSWSSRSEWTLTVGLLTHFMCCHFMHLLPVRWAATPPEALWFRLVRPSVCESIHVCPGRIILRPACHRLLVLYDFILITCNSCFMCLLNAQYEGAITDLSGWFYSQLAWLCHSSVVKLMNRSVHQHKSLKFYLTFSQSDDM